MPGGDKVTQGWIPYATYDMENVQVGDREAARILANITNKAMQRTCDRAVKQLASREHKKNPRLDDLCYDIENAQVKSCEYSDIGIWQHHLSKTA